MIEVVQAKLQTLDEGRVELRAPFVGIWVGGPAQGAVVRPGDDLGVVEVLGLPYRLVAPAGAAGMVVEVRDPKSRRRAVSFGDALLTLDPSAAGAAVADEAASSDAAAGITGQVFASPMSGRFYTRPSPDKPPFVADGQVLEPGQTVCLLEVMKTFNRVTYGGAGLPARAKVIRVMVEDGADVDEGAPLLELEPA